ncbi:hypothetical protein PsorP6_010957 [Peronosclerospora sorghi]|uniref:Uncharacterized protein n=1 Tax=Peronosclerospora sorghi TaxID=230839 RepID=A0ACC0VZ13_9STRA|nr:hypothetical protein PsorP6_010957 [Peronosclerospora sorghi]
MELCNHMRKELLIIVRKCGHISIVSDYMSSVESFKIGHVTMKSVTIASATYVSFDDAAYDTVLASPTPLTQPQVDRLTRESQNSVQSGNYLVWLHYVIDLVLLSCEVANQVSPIK